MLRALEFGFDFDGVFVNFAELTHLVLPRLFSGRKVAVGRERSDMLILDGVLSREEYRQFADEVCCNEQYIPLMQPLPRLSTRLAHLRALACGANIRVITHRNPKGAAVAQKWVDSHCLGVKVESSNQDRTKAVAAEGLDVFVDDSLEHLEEVAGIVPHRFLFSWPYNEHDVLDPSIVRVHSWDELAVHIGTIATAHSKE